jgi:hypothetical protein
LYYTFILEQQPIMQILSSQRIHFVIANEKGETVGHLVYKDNLLKTARLLWGDDVYAIMQTGIGSWTSYQLPINKRRKTGELKVMAGGLVNLNMPFFGTKYKFKRTGGWKIRFVLLNKEGDEVLALVPSIDWHKKTHNFLLQINEEYIDECSVLLILHTVHCANCCLSMMNGGPVPALIKI